MKLKNINMPKPTPEQLALMPQNAIGDIGTRYDIAANPGDGITLSYCVTYFPYIQLIYSDITGENKALFFIWNEDLATANSIFGTSFTTAGWFLVATDFSTIEAYTGTLDIDTSIFNQVYSRTYFDLLFIYNIACASTSGVNLLTAQKYCEGNIKVVPVLQEKTATENGEYTVDNGYAGLSKVTVNVASGAELNIAYGDTAPSDTSKLWVNGAEPLKVIASNKINGSETISTVGNVSVNISDFGVARVGDYIYIFGGVVGSSASSAIYKYNIKTNETTKLSATLPTTVSGVSAVAMGTTIYVIYGSVFKFDTLTDTLSESIGGTATTTTGRASGTAVAIGTDIYVFGGVYSSTYTNTIYKIDTTTDAISQVNGAYGYIHMCSVAFGDYIYLFGGSYKTSYYNNIWRYDTKAQTLVNLTNTLPKTLRNAWCGRVGNYAYIFGGISNNDYSNTIYRYDLINNTIEQLSVVLPYKTYGARCVVDGTNIYIVGGVPTSGGRTNTVQKFVVEQALNNNELLINTTLNKNLFKIINAPTAEVEIGVNGVYRGNANNIAEKETAMVYDESQYAWVTVDGGVVVDKLASAVTITSEASEYAYNVYDGTDTSGVLRATLGGTNGTLSAKIPCYSGYLFIKGVTPDTIATTLTSGGTLNIEETANAGEYLVTCKGNSNEFIDGSLNITYGVVSAGFTVQMSLTGHTATVYDGQTATGTGVTINETPTEVTCTSGYLLVTISSSNYFSGLGDITGDITGEKISYSGSGYDDKAHLYTVGSDGSILNIGVYLD